MKRISSIFKEDVQYSKVVKMDKTWKHQTLKSSIFSNFHNYVQPYLTDKTILCSNLQVEILQ